MPTAYRYHTAPGTTATPTDPNGRELFARAVGVIPHLPPSGNPALRHLFRRVRHSHIPRKPERQARTPALLKQPGPGEAQQLWPTPLPSARVCGREPYIGQAQGQELLHKTYTIAGQSDSLRVTLESQFSIASVSKRLIRYGVLLLAQQGRLSLQDPISRFLPDFPRGQDITVAQLLSHQSGLPRELTNDRQLEQVSLVRTIELARQLAHGLPQRRNAVLLLLPRKPNATPAGRWGGGAQWWQKADGFRKNSRT